MKTIKGKVTRVNSIRQAAGNNGLPGNYLINQKTGEDGKPTPESWYPSRDIRNALLGSGIAASLPCFLLEGCTLVHDVLVIEQGDIDAAKAEGKQGLEYKLANRKDPVIFKQAGSHNINVSVDMKSLPFETKMGISELTMKYGRQVQAPRPSAAPATADTAEDIVEETITEDVPHEDLTEEQAGIPAENMGG